MDLSDEKRIDEHSGWKMECISMELKELGMDSWFKNHARETIVGVIVLKSNVIKDYF